MSFLHIVAANCCSMALNFFFLLWMAGTLLGRVPNRERKHKLM